MDKSDVQHEGREEKFVDVDRMLNEGLGGGQVTDQNGLITDSVDLTEEEPPREGGKED